VMLRTVDPEAPPRSNTGWPTSGLAWSRVPLALLEWTELGVPRQGSGVSVIDTWRYGVVEGKAHPTRFLREVTGPPANALESKGTVLNMAIAAPGSHNGHSDSDGSPSQPWVDQLAIPGRGAWSVGPWRPECRPSPLVPKPCPSPKTH
jgi:hypothetical protein